MGNTDKSGRVCTPKKSISMIQWSNKFLYDAKEVVYEKNKEENIHFPCILHGAFPVYGNTGAGRGK